MSTDDDPSLRDRVERWLAREMPIIQMHGGTSAVRTADPETGEVVIELGGGCRGCGVSDVTTGNITAELLAWEDVEDVTVRVPDAEEALGAPEGGQSIMGVERNEGSRGPHG